MNTVIFGASTSISERLNKAKTYEDTLQATLEAHRSEFEALPEKITNVHFMRVNKPIHLGPGGGWIGPSITIRPIYAQFDGIENAGGGAPILQLPYQQWVGLLPASRKKMDQAIKAVLEYGKNIGSVHKQ